MREVEISQRPLASLAGLLPAAQASAFEAALRQAADALAGRVVWNVSSTAAGGGVAEMLQNLLGYLVEAGVNARWLVLDAGDEFFAITKKIHNSIHGVGDPPGEVDHEKYQRVLAHNLPGMLQLVKPGDIVLLNDPQTAGITGPLRAAGLAVAWRSHIGRDTQTATSIAAWDFLRGYLNQADAFVFSRKQYAPDWVPAERLWVIPPSIDPLSPKNRPIPAAGCVRILTEAGLLATIPVPARMPAPGAPPPDARLVVQVSRWDRLKDMAGVMEGFRRAHLPGDVHLMLAGPATVADDPEGTEVLAECQAAHARLPERIRDRVWLASIPTADVELNATIVNALQRYAALVVQKSLVEGFGLTVAEAMWKERPVIASAVGGIQDQISSEHTGVLVEDPSDLDSFAGALSRVLSDPALADRLGRAAHDQILRDYLDDRQLVQSARLFETLAGMVS